MGLSFFKRSFQLLAFAQSSNEFLVLLRVALARCFSDTKNGDCPHFAMEIFVVCKKRLLSTPVDLGQSYLFITASKQKGSAVTHRGLKLA
jgi:hypothetical protein